MSEIGPIKVRFRFFCRMISWPAAKGIICSICRPSATLAPSGTSSAIASDMGRSLDISDLRFKPMNHVYADREVHHAIQPLGKHFVYQSRFIGGPNCPKKNARRRPDRED